MKMMSADTVCSAYAGMHKRGKQTLLGALLVSAGLLLGACDSGDHDSHGHEHGSEAGAHDHGDGAHSHDSVPATEAYYGEQEESDGAADSPEPDMESGHTHGDGDEHSHDH